ncbi:hypothetical protein [Streptomyces indiaensis]|uniref:Uncharacterized protein n=1 Tax=Streptomyces indiaensis TaxID=284033 RepID=A0ABN3D453_9ACTN|nr:hypothetical protein [Streptomyces indiaensis]MCF1645467.1 hypothetical protein [Streptomyces indiaensis]
MIRIVRTKTLRALQAGITEAEAATASARAEAEQRTNDVRRAADSAFRAETALEALRAEHARTVTSAARNEGELQTLRAQQLLDTEDRAALRLLLRTVRKSAAAQQVFVLLKHGQFHSVHPSRPDAEKAAEREGAHPDGWLTHGAPGTNVPASEVLWRIQPTPLAGEAR